MKKLLLVCAAVLILSAGNLGCTGITSDMPRYTENRVIEKALARSDVGLDSHVEWVWSAVFLPAQPDLKLKGVWKVEQTGFDLNSDPVSQITYFSEDTGKFTYVR